MIHHEPAAQINQASAMLHSAEFVLPEQVLVLCLAVDMQGDHIRGLQQFAKTYRARIPTCKDMRDVAKHNAHAQRFRKIGYLRADFAVPNDAQSKSADFMRSSRRLVPDPVV